MKALDALGLEGTLQTVDQGLVTLIEHTIEGRVAGAPSALVNLLEKFRQVTSSLTVDSVGLNIHEMEMVKQRRPIDAIRAIRQRKDIGLKEAKDLVDAYRAELMRVPQ